MDRGFPLILFVVTCIYGDAYANSCSHADLTCFPLVQGQFARSYSAPTLPKTKADWSTACNDLTHAIRCLDEISDDCEKTASTVAMSTAYKKLTMNICDPNWNKRQMIEDQAVCLGKSTQTISARCPMHLAYIKGKDKKESCKKLKSSTDCALKEFEKACKKDGLEVFKTILQPVLDGYNAECAGVWHTSYIFLVSIALSITIFRNSVY